MSTPNYRAVTGVGHVVAAEVDTLFTPWPRRAATKFPVLLCHGSNGPYQFINVASYHSSRIPGYLAQSGIPSMSAQTHGQTYANDQSMTDLTTMVTYIKAQLSLTGTKVGLLGISMGGAQSLRYAGLHPSDVSCVVGIIPLTDINAYYNGLSAGATKTEIATAWGVTSPNPLPAGADLTTVCAPMNGQVPSRLYYASDDPLVNPAWTTALASVIGGTAINMGTGGHTETSIGNALAYGSGGAGKEIRDFFIANGS